MAAVTTHALTDPGAQHIASNGVQMQGWHALALVGLGLWSPRGGMLTHAAGVAFAAGMVLFCGSVYALAIGGINLGRIAPTGGILLMAGWALFCASAIRCR
ncbi:DUF423 domain-containing protein [Rhodopila sp.]|uniref:DUF423 domain-containing protein n=1 Tax=Rhodopila sp. TaxID=2480087 RepID=UPI002C9FF64B|nr:DUF423 domain-containing protein [Rhodopila sp.]HVZ09343.1 DUF423 domain-containing protein [Rhodopila sp.]